MRKLLTYCGAIVMAFATANVNAIALSDLIAGQNITVGDKLFDEWSLINLEDLDAGPMDLSMIDVTGVGDGTAGNAYGLQFAANGQWAAVGDDFLDLFFGFSVEVLDPLKQITGASMAGTISTEGDDHLIVVEKDVYNYDTGAGLAFLEIYSDPFDDPSLNLSAAAGFAGQSKIWVEDNIFVDGFGGFADLILLVQRFDQEEMGDVPEPATLALFALGLLGLGWARRRRYTK